MILDVKARKPARIVNSKFKGTYSSEWYSRDRAVGCRLPYGITQCFLLPDTSKHCCCCCHDEPVRQLPIWGDKDVLKRWGIPPDSESGGIRLSLVLVDSHLLIGAPLKGSCRCPQLTIKRSMLTDVDKLPSCSRFSDSVVGFTAVKRPNQQHHSTYHSSEMCGLS